MSGPESVSVQSLLDRITDSSAAFAERATALSGTIEQIADSLRQMPGKTDCYVERDNIKLSFDRFPSWGLWLTDSESYDDDGREISPEDLTTVSIPRKARAFPLLLELLPKIEADQIRLVSEIDKVIGQVQVDGGSAGASKPKPLFSREEVAKYTQLGKGGE